MRLRVLTKRITLDVFMAQDLNIYPLINIKFLKTSNAKCRVKIARPGARAQERYRAW
jgi:hypothetical protein